MGDSINSISILDNSPFACVLLEKNHLRIKYINQAMQKFLALTNIEEIHEENFLKFVPEKGKPAFFELIEHISHPTADHVWKALDFQDKNGYRKKMLIQGTREEIQPNADGRILLTGIPFGDIDKVDRSSPQTGKNSKLRYQDDKYKSIIESATIGISILDKNGYIEEANPRFVDNICMDEDEILEKHYCNVFSGKVTAKISKMLRDVKKSEQNHVRDILHIKKGDQGHAILDVSLSEIFNDFEGQYKYMIITEDITDLQDSQAALVQSEKLALTGRLAASLAHEINNPLQTSLGCLGLAEEMLNEDDEDLRTYLRLATEELQRSARIVKRLRDLNRSTDPSERTEVNIQELIDGVLLLTKNHLQDRNIVPVFLYNGPPPLILGSKDQIQQVLLNLAINAIDAMPNGGNIYFEITPTVDPVGKIISIRDTGMGFDPKVKNRAFDPFLTTKEDGIGLGLYLSKKIIEDHDGWIQLESKENQGTKISIWLPSFDVTSEKE